MDGFDISKYTILREGIGEDIKCSLTGHEAEPGIVFLMLDIASEREIVPAGITVCWICPDIDIHLKWNPNAGYNRLITPDWTAESCKSRAVSGAPIQALMNINGENRLTIAVSDALNPLEIATDLNEVSANIICKVKFFTGPVHPFTKYSAVIRLDTRSIPYYESLSQASSWWSAMPEYKPAEPPDYALLPVFSTWYSFHEDFTSDQIIAQCKLAKEIGCRSVIVDGGWMMAQTFTKDWTAYSGDWEPAEAKIRDMKEFVGAVHGIGMKFLLWYSVPFIGRHTKAWNRLKGMFLNDDAGDYCALDTRFPEAREYLIEIYEKAAKEWELDGLKLDFIDNFRIDASYDNPNGGCRDYQSLDESIDRLLQDVTERLRSIKQDIMIEFRQSYTGPLMRKYANMFRATDCPYDFITNRTRTIDLRLLCGNTAVHSDMLMWNINDTVVSAAMQIINILFAVPQISVRIDRISDSHRKILKYWLKVWLENRDVFIGGKLLPLHPEANYSTVISANSEKLAAVAYSCPVIAVPNIRYNQLMLINGTYENRLLLETACAYENANYEVHDCCGELLESGLFERLSGLHSFNVPPAGIIFINKNAATGVCG